MQISASILSANFLNLESEINKLIENKIDILHYDVMDGCFVPNISFGKEILSQIYQKFKDKIKIEVHLMINNPEKFIDDFLDADMISFHFEATNNHLQIIDKIKKNNKKVGIAIKPKTQKEEIIQILPYIDYILIMTVEPGFAGQKFMADQVTKIRDISDYIKNNNLDLQIHVDGGINEENINICYENGARVFCMAKYIFQAEDLSKNIQNLKNRIVNAK